MCLLAHGLVLTQLLESRSPIETRVSVTSVYTKDKPQVGMRVPQSQGKTLGDR